MLDGQSPPLLPNEIERIEQELAAIQQIINLQLQLITAVEQTIALYRESTQELEQRMAILQVKLRK